MDAFHVSRFYLFAKMTRQTSFCENRKVAVALDFLIKYQIFDSIEFGSSHKNSFGLHGTVLCIVDCRTSQKKVLGKIFIAQI